VTRHRADSGILWMKFNDDDLIKDSTLHCFDWPRSVHISSCFQQVFSIKSLLSGHVSLLENLMQLAFLRYSLRNHFENQFNCAHETTCISWRSRLNLDTQPEEDNERPSASLHVQYGSSVECMGNERSRYMHFSDPARLLLEANTNPKLSRPERIHFLTFGFSFLECYLFLKETADIRQISLFRTTENKSIHLETRII
jgi:hypothetical protein